MAARLRASCSVMVMLRHQKGTWRRRRRYSKLQRRRRPAERAAARVAVTAVAVDVAAGAAEAVEALQRTAMVVRCQLLRMQHRS